MKLGTHTGSLMNHLHSRGTIGQPTPTVGMGATILGWTDRYPATITAVETYGKATIITIQEDHAMVVAGSTQDGSAEYEYRPNSIGSQSKWRSIGPDGAWQSVYFNEETKRWKRTGERGLRIGEREAYRDPSF